MDIKTTWVIGVFNGKRAQIIKGHADDGLGYIIREESGGGNSYRVEAAFRRANDSPIPDYLTACSDIQSEKLEKLRKKRQGIIDRS